MRRLIYLAIALMLSLSAAAQTQSFEFYYIAHDRTTPVADLCDRLEQVYETALSYEDYAVIFYLPEKMNQETANRLLKMVEEPPEKTLFIFITHSPEKVLQTIFSRCQSIRVMPLTKEEAAKVKALNPFDDSEEYDRFMDLFSDTMRAVTAGDLQSALECGEIAAALESREKQKAFCTFAARCIRKIFMLQQNMPQIADVMEQERDFYEEMAKRCGKGFCVRTITNIENVVAMIDRNVNSKILFCDLVNRMYLGIWSR